MKKIICFIWVSFSTLIYAQIPTVGLIQHNAGSLDNGYVVFAPIQSDTTYLIDKCGKKLHQWASNRGPGLSVYLLSDGSILRTEAIANPSFNTNGATGGKIERIDWNSNSLWSYTLSNTTETQNHDVYPLPNGNILVSVWVNISTVQATAAGRDPSILGTSIWSAKIVELQPVGTNSATIVWEWDLMDHLVQDFDNTKSNYGVVTDHPELLNFNFNGTNLATSVDWIHLNAITYNATLDQIMFSAHNLSEIFIIDHSTTTVEAASHSGGTHGKGGDFLYRWGNPQSYNRGTVSDRKLFLQHNPTWIPSGYKDDGKIMIFNNGSGRPGGNASSVDIISQPMIGNGDYTLSSGQPFGPTAIDWAYMDLTPTNFYSQVMGSAQRLSNGNTLICEATKGNFFEIDSLKNIVWQYINPVSSTGAISQGSTSTTTEVFRCIFYPDTSSVFIGKNITAGNPIELNPYNYSCNLITGLQEINAEHSITLFPNPTSDYLNIKSEETVKLIEVINSKGQTVITSTNSYIDLSKNPSGIYLIKITTANQHLLIRKLIKN